MSKPVKQIIILYIIVVIVLAALIVSFVAFINQATQVHCSDFIDQPVTSVPHECWQKWSN